MNIRFLTICCLLGFCIYVLTQPNMRSRILQWLSSSPCEHPIAYKLGSLDPKFKMGTETALTDMQAATSIWSSTYGAPLFTQSNTATLTVNFVYDERSALFSQINQQQSQLDTKNTSLEKQITQYESDVKSFEAKMAAFNAQVDASNKSGGASQETYDAFVSQQKTLNSEADALNTRAKQLNLATRNYNVHVKDLNQNVNQFNDAISVKPEEGVYSSGNQTITIYFASNHQELLHTLAHEFGHALGMQHTSLPNSIMYPQTTPSFTMTPEDRDQLTQACQSRLLPEEWIPRLRSWMQQKAPPGLLPKTLL